jgi:hypothetical protein
MVTITELADDCAAVLARFEHDIEPFRQGRMTIHANNVDVTADQVARTDLIIAELRRLHAKLVADAQGS